MELGPGKRNRDDIQSIPAASLWDISIQFIGSRLLIWIVAGASLLVVRKGQFYVAQASPLEWFKRWDARSFLEIAAHGYAGTQGAKPNFPFLPLYPILVGFASLGGAINLALAGQLVSLAGLWCACILLWKTVMAEIHDERVAILSVSFLLFSPVSFFYSSPYSESLFLALSIGCLHYMRGGRWWLAGFLGALAALTRFIGIMLVVPMAWEAIGSFRNGRTASARRLRALLASLMPVLGFLGYCIFLRVYYGDFLLYFHVEQRFWGRQFAWFWLFLSHESFSNLPAFYQILFGGALIGAFALLVAGVLLRIPRAFTVYGLALLSVYISSRLAEALPRYISVVFPLYIVTAILAAKWPRAAMPLIAMSAALEAVFVVLFVNGYWFT
ncbi:MAG TPA: mannosyltransferase family protein [Opitutaceae bacterium]|jgi:Gpi18-like mannosyltransferase